MIGLPEGFNLSVLLSDYFTLGGSVLALVTGLVIAGLVHKALRRMGG